MVLPLVRSQPVVMVAVQLTKVRKSTATVPDARTVSTRPWPYQVPTKPAGTLSAAERCGDTVTVTVEEPLLAGADCAVDAPPVGGFDGAAEVAGKSAGSLLDSPADIDAVPCPSVIELQPATRTATHIAMIHRATPAMASPPALRLHGPDPPRLSAADRWAHCITARRCQR